MIILNRPQTDPFFNLAAEEYLVKNTKEPLFMLWQNTASVVIGKHQNAYKEINLRFLKENNIPAIRRISGGGTVFHDLGNLNYSFIDFGAREHLVNFKKYSQPILDVLNGIGVNAKLVGKSDLKIDEMKFSGNASHVYKNTVLHHGTLLFTSELTDLEKSINYKTDSYTDKAVKSNRSRVTNIQSHLIKPLSIQEFKQQIFDHIQYIYPNTKTRDFTADELSEIQQLANQKYKSWEWNFGYSPRYQLQGVIDTKNKPVTFHLNIRNGEIEAADFGSNPDKETQKLTFILIGCQHQTEALEKLYDTNNELFNMFKIDKSIFLKSFFG